MPLRYRMRRPAHNDKLLVMTYLFNESDMKFWEFEIAIDKVLRWLQELEA